jgi:phosphotriesterase-related protein
VTIHTVLGPIDRDALGLTSMHEHLLVDCRALYAPPPSPPPNGDQVCIENLGWLHWNNQGLLDNLVVDDPELVCAELSAFAGAGGRSVVDLTNIGLGRRVEQLPAIAEKSGVNVMVGCGWYRHPSHPPEVEASTPEQLAQAMIDELDDGVGDTGIRPALIGEIGTSAPITSREVKVLTAAAWAALQTGAAINIHVEAGGAHGLEVTELLIGEGVPPRRLILSHMDERLDLDYHLALLGTGAILEFDTFGMEAYWEFPFGDPTDHERFQALGDLIRRGYVDQIVLGCDVYTKTCHSAWGGQGYRHLPERVRPTLRDFYDISDEHLKTMLVSTPASLLDRP